MQRDDSYRSVDREAAPVEGSLDWADGARWILILSAVGWLVLIGVAAIL